eukprot:NODE_15_length_50561_cov_0.608081.p15 type:complete len:376 gc:universal NODE_15_length_50561_cov_0.608081:45801-44674(-)
MIFTTLQAIQLFSTLKTDHPAFLNVIDDKLTVSSFGVFKCKVTQFGYQMSSFALDFSEGTTVGQSTGMAWPNEIVPTNTPSAGALIGDGFLVPGHSNGAIWFLKDGQASQLTKKQNGWFYHKALELDVNQDGIMDIVSCRAKTSLFGATQSKLVWFDGSKQFEEVEIMDGCDVNFIITDLDKDGKKEIIFSGFWSQRLSIIVSKTGKFNNAADLRIVDIATDIGKAFNLELVDLNNDGISDLLVTNHQGTKDKITGKIYAFSPNKSGTVENWTWKKTILFDNIPVRNSGQNEAAPGTAISLPIKNSKGYPYLAAGGDGSQEAYLLVPRDTPLSYDVQVITNCGGTVGELHYDTLGGQDLLMVPCYDANEIRFFKF